MSESVTWKVPPKIEQWAIQGKLKAARRAERVQLAGMAMMGMLAGDEPPSTYNECARAARKHADALLAELDRTEAK